MKRVARCLFALSTIVSSGLAFADDKASAQASFDLGRQLMVEGRFVEACPKLEESLRLQAGVGTMLFLAACYEKTGRTASAWAQFREAESLATRVNDGRAQVAREKANALEPKLAKLAIVVPSSLRSVAGLEVKRDNVIVGPGVYDAPIPVDPGVRKIVVSATGKKAWAGEVNVAPEDGTAMLRLPEGLEDAPAGAGESAGTGAGTGTGTDASGDGKTQRTIGIVLGGVGVVSLVISGVLGLSAKSKLDESNANGHCVGNKCDGVGTDARNDARDVATISTVTFFVGLAAVGGGAALFLTAPKDKRSVAIAPTLRGVAVSGSF